MADVVRERWLEFTGPLEGAGVPCLYTDVRQTPEHPHGIPTTAWGNAIFTASEMCALPWMHPGGIPATQAEMIATWHKLHEDPIAQHRGWTYAAKLSDLRLTREAMGELALAKFDSNDRILRARLADWDSYPACARMAFHSLAWACGANAHFPRLFDDARGRDWDACAVEIHMNEYTPEGIHNVGLVPRNIANVLLLRNAQRIEAFHLDPSTLNWTSLLGVSDAVTLPALPDVPDSRPEPTTPADQPTIHPDQSAYLRPEEWEREKG